MKTNLYIFLVFLLSVSFASAQNTSEVTETVNIVTVENDNETIANQVNNDNETLLIDAAQLKQTIARGASDIRKYFTIERKAGNINVVFPKSNKAVKA